MSRRDATILRAAAVWTLYVWVTRIWNIWHGQWSFAFKAVHTVLAVVSIAFAVAVWGVARRGRRRAAPPAPPASPDDDPATPPAGTVPSGAGGRSRSTPPSTR